VRKSLNMFLFAALSIVAGVSVAYADPFDAGGYDENTELTVQGVVSEVGVRPRGPVVLGLTVDGKSYKVVTAPSWYLVREGIVFTKGSELAVTGSKSFERDGLLYIFAREVKDLAAGKVSIFRDRACRPMWRMMGPGAYPPPPPPRRNSPPPDGFWPPWR